jgi:hypothetical protein
VGSAEFLVVCLTPRAGARRVMSHYSASYARLPKLARLPFVRQRPDVVLIHAATSHGFWHTDVLMPMTRRFA